MNPADLPAPLADPLHILTPTLLERLAWPLAGLLLALLGRWLFRRWLASRRRQAPQSAPAPTTEAPMTAGGAKQALDDIRDATERSRDFRRGCHDLASFLRQHYRAAGRYRFHTLTVPEIAADLGDRPLVGIFERLSGLQFRRQEPTREDFLIAYLESVDAVDPEKAMGSGKTAGGKAS